MLEWQSQIGARELGVRTITPPEAHREGGSKRAVTVSEIELVGIRLWTGPSVSKPESYGKGAGLVHSLRGTTPEPSCHEVELAEAIRAVRDKAYWFTPGGFYEFPVRWRPWARSIPRRTVKVLPKPPGWLVDLDQEVRAHMSVPIGGIPDVIAWNETDPKGTAIFVECKGASEPFREGQEDWMWAACQFGVDPTQVAISIRPDPSRGARRPASATAARRTGSKRRGTAKAPTRATPSPPPSVLSREPTADLSGAALRRAVMANTHRKPEGLKRVEAGVYDLPYGGSTYRITQRGPSAWVTTLDGKRVGEVQQTRGEAYLMVRTIGSN
jgi:hypothetical protein